MCSRFLEAAAVCACVLAAGCTGDREQRAEFPPPGALVKGNQQSPLQPGGHDSAVSISNPIEPDEQILGEGKRLYNQFNCSGCHAAGGGAIGPPLMDDEWIYGSGAANIFWTIVEGRPQGMPAFGGKIPEQQIWRIVAYVRSMSKLHEKEQEEAKASMPRPVAQK